MLLLPRPTRLARTTAVASSDQPVIVVVGTDPVPQKAALDLKGQRAVAAADADGPPPTDLLEAQGGMIGVLFEQREALVGLLSSPLWKGVIGLPEAFVGYVSHEGLPRDDC
jgi:hypothetical protein